MKKIEFFITEKHQPRLVGSISLQNNLLIARGHSAKLILQDAMQNVPLDDIESIWFHIKKYALKRENSYWRVIIRD